MADNGLDVSYRGLPYADLTSGGTTDLTLDMSYGGQPFTTNVLVSDQTVSAGVQTVTVTANEATIPQWVDAGQNTVTVSAPTATLSATSDYLLGAGNQVIDVTAPTAQAHQSQTIGENLVTVTAPDVAKVNLTIPLTANTIAVTAPSTDIARLLTAGVQVVTLSAPTVVFGRSIPATANVLTVSAPVAAFKDKTLAPDTNLVSIVVPGAYMDIVRRKFPLPQDEMVFSNNELAHKYPYATSQA